jgi:type IV pilus assembly protein PilE
MKGDKGFTLIELMVVIAILGVLAASAYPTYQTFRQRAVGAEATYLMNQLVQAQIAYFLEHETYFPGGAALTIVIGHDDPPNDADIEDVRQALHVTLPVGHFLDYTLQFDPDPGPPQDKKCIMTISTPGNSFPIFKDGSTSLTVVVHEDGTVEYQ